METKKNNNILIIDDDRHIGQMLKIILEQKGYKVIFHKNAEQVKETIKTRDIDVVILDMHLSDVNGT